MQEIRSTSALRFPRLMDYFKYRLLLEDWFLEYVEYASVYVRNRAYMISYCE